MNNLFDYTLRIADNALILGHRLSELCGHGPVLEQDIAMTNIALDLVGQARTLYQYAAEVQNAGKTEDDIAYLRDVYDFKNLLLVEQPNGDFADTVVRQFFFSAFQLPFYEKLVHSKDDILRGVAEKAVKELTYHLRWSSEWLIRLGDGTDESHERAQKAVDKNEETPVLWVKNRPKSADFVCFNKNYNTIGKLNTKDKAYESRFWFGGQRAVLLAYMRQWVNPLCTT